MALHVHHADSGAAKMIGDAPAQPPAPPTLTPTAGEQAYVHKLLTTKLGADIEAGLAVTIDRYLAVHDALLGVVFPDPPKSGHPHRCRQSPRWREAQAAYLGARAVLVAMISERYPDLSHGRPGGPIVATKALIEHRVGPLCKGRAPGPGEDIVHHPQLPCPVHDQTQ